MLYTTRALRYSRCPSQRRDRTKALRGLSVSVGSTAGIGVDSREILIIAEARFESVVLSIVGDVVGTADTVVDVLAEVGGIGVGRIANLETECVGAHEVVPFDDLGEGIQIGVGAESIGENNATQRVSSQIGAVWVHLTTKVARVEVNLGLVDETDNLEVGGGFDELNALESVGGDEAGPPTGFGTPSNHFSFLISDEFIWIGRSP